MGPARWGGKREEQAGPGANEWLSGALHWVGMDPAAVAGLQASPSPSPDAPHARSVEHTDQSALAAQLFELGFSQEQSLAAAKRTSSVEAGVDWITKHG